MRRAESAPHKNVASLGPTTFPKNIPEIWVQLGEQAHNTYLTILETIQERMNAGGILMITSPYTWLEEHTDKGNWVGGRKVDGENVSTFEGLKAMLAPHFDLVQGPISVPFVIRETSRKFQHTLSEATLWRYRG